jgi:hypothetical protein
LKKTAWAWAAVLRFVFYTQNLRWLICFYLRCLADNENPKNPRRVLCTGSAPVSFLFLARRQLKKPIGRWASDRRR